MKTIELPTRLADGLVFFMVWLLFATVSFTVTLFGGALYIYITRKVGTAGEDSLTVLFILAVVVGIAMGTFITHALYHNTCEDSV